MRKSLIAPGHRSSTMTIWQRCTTNNKVIVIVPGSRMAAHDGSGNVGAASWKEAALKGGRDLDNHHAVAPPSMRKSAAVTQVDSSEARNVAHQPMSSGWP